MFDSLILKASKMVPSASLLCIQYKGVELGKLIQSIISNDVNHIRGREPVGQRKRD